MRLGRSCRLQNAPQKSDNATNKIPELAKGCDIVNKVLFLFRFTSSVAFSSLYLLYGDQCFLWGHIILTKIILRPLLFLFLPQTCLPLLRSYLKLLFTIYIFGEGGWGQIYWGEEGRGQNTINCWTKLFMSWCVFPTVLAVILSTCLRLDSCR